MRAPILQRLLHLIACGWSLAVAGIGPVFWIVDEQGDVVRGAVIYLSSSAFNSIARLNLPLFIRDFGL
jgi:hypothetical protein